MTQQLNSKAVSPWMKMSNQKIRKWEQC